MSGERILFAVVGLGFFWAAFVIWWYTRHLRLPRLYVATKVGGFVALGIFVASGGEWGERYLWWLVPVFLGSTFATDLLMIDRSRAPRFFWVKLGLFLILIATIFWTLGPFGGLVSAGCLIAAVLLYVGANIFRPKDALITADPSSKPPAASCSPRSPTTSG
jgi:hypothetical protein